jgi:hypothetical protein
MNMVTDVRMPRAPRHIADLLESTPRSRRRSGDVLGILGRGKDGTLVYPAEQIPSRFAADACVRVVYAGVRASSANASRTRTACIDVSDAPALERAGLGSDVAIKDVRDEASAKAEAAIHTYLRTCFRGARKMPLCCLHPRIEAVSVDDHALLPMRTGVPIDRASSDDDTLNASALLSLARGVLGALSVMHANRVLHLDVKPQNVMSVPLSVPLSVPAVVRDDATSFVLVDYDLTAHFDDVLDAMRDGPVPVGTPGYISPLLLGRMEPSCVRCCLAASSDASRAACARFNVHVPQFDDAAWLEQFATLRHRALSSSSAAAALLPQIDLHSLAVTLHRLAKADPVREGHANGRDRDRLTAVIGGLIGGAFETAKEALKVCGSDG